MASPESAGASILFRDDSSSREERPTDDGPPIAIDAARSLMINRDVMTVIDVS